MLRKLLAGALVFSLAAVAVQAGEDAGQGKSEKPGAGAVAYSTSAKAESVGDKAPRVVKVLTSNEKIQSNRYVPRTFELKYANPYNVVYFIKDVVASEGGMYATYLNTEKGATGGLLMVVVPEYQLESIGKMVESLDRADLTDSSGTKWEYVQLRNRSCMDPQPPMSLLLYGSTDNTVKADPKTNGFYVQGSPSGVAAIAKAAATYDVPTAQATITARIYEVNSSNDASLGLDFMSWKNGPGQDLFTAGKSESHIDTPTNSVQTNSHVSGYSLEYPSEFFDFLMVKGKARILNESKVTALSGVAAEFRTTEQILYYPVTTNADGDRVVTAGLTTREGDAAFISTDAKAARTVERKGPVEVNPDGGTVDTARSNTAMVAEAGVILSVTPIIARNNIDLTVQTTVNNLVGFDGAGIPLIKPTVVDTQVRARDGEEVVLGRMTVQRDITMANKMPVLGSIPVVGYLFGTEGPSSKVSSLIEVITPKVVEKGGLTPEDEAVTKRAAKEEDTELPKDEYFFEQYGMDKK
jgi:type II secretory pathway component GspD/PulD (secretin)